MGASFDTYLATLAAKLSASSALGAAKSAADVAAALGAAFADCPADAKPELAIALRAQAGAIDRTAPAPIVKGFLLAADTLEGIGADPVKAAITDPVLAKATQAK